MKRHRHLSLPAGGMIAGDPEEASTVVVDLQGGNAFRFYRMQVLPGFRLSPPRRGAGGIVEMTLEAPAGFRFAIKSSGDMKVWSPVSEVTTAAELTRVTDSAPITEPLLFYRPNLLH